MTENEIIHGQLMRKLRRAVDTTVKFDKGGEQAIEAAATALTDLLAEVLVKLPAAADGDGAGIISMAMSNRLVRRMAAEMLTKGTLIDLSAAHTYAATARAVQGEVGHA